MTWECNGCYRLLAMSPAGAAESGHRLPKTDVMSNHSGSHMLNSLLTMIERESFFSDIGPERAMELISHVLGLAMEHDGNLGEVLNGIGERLGICYQCRQQRDELHHGVCSSCGDR